MHIEVTKEYQEDKLLKLKGSLNGVSEDIKQELLNKIAGKCQSFIQKKRDRITITWYLECDCNNNEDPE